MPAQWLERAPQGGLLFGDLFGDDRPVSSNRDARSTTAHLPLLPVQIVRIPLQDRVVGQFNALQGNGLFRAFHIARKALRLFTRMKNRGGCRRHEAGLKETDLA
jgi:hypothetical protein